MKVYPDTSVLASLYLQDTNSPIADELMAKFSSSLVLSPLHDFEVTNAIEIAVFRRQVDRKQAGGALKDFQTDRQHWETSALPLDCFARAAMLARRYTATRGRRSLDLLHVAVALGLGAEAFLTFDARQRALARAAKLLIFPNLAQK